MIRSMQKRHLMTLLALVLALFALVLLHPTASAAEDEEELSGANIQNGVLLGYYGSESDITLPNTVTRINDEALKGNKKIVSVTIPGSVKDIGNNAFQAAPT